jgi:hypothetical protein
MSEAENTVGLRHVRLRVLAGYKTTAAALALSPVNLLLLPRSKKVPIPTYGVSALI